MRERIAAAFICMLLSAAGAGAQQSGSEGKNANAGTGAVTATPSHDAEAAPAVAPAQAPKPAAKTSRRVPPGSELDMVRTCRVHGQRTMEYIDQLTRSVQQAQLTRDSAQTRAALDQMQASLSQMKQHMTICMERLAQAH